MEAMVLTQESDIEMTEEVASLLLEQLEMIAGGECVVNNI